MNHIEGKVSRSHSPFGPHLRRVDLILLWTEGASGTKPLPNRDTVRGL